MARAYGSPEGPGTSLRRAAAASDVDTVARIRAARRDPEHVVLEGVHALKHAVRFGADVEVVATPDRAALERLLAELAPDVQVGVRPTELTADSWRELVPRELPSPALAVARRPAGGVGEVLAATGRVLVLEEPRHLGNLGAAIRVAAAAGAGGVLVVGAADPWHPTAVRAAAGLQYALAVARTDTLPATDRAVAALHPEGDELVRGGLPHDIVLLVGTERGGLSEELLARADARWRLPMRAGVSSLNLATAVAAALYR
jgi:RNA methyltransferase, TrmH family